MVKEAEANDPAFLRKRIRELERELRAAGDGEDRSAALEQLQTENEQLRAHMEILEASVSTRDEVLAAAAEAADAVASMCRPELERPLKPPVDARARSTTTQRIRVLEQFNEAEKIRDGVSARARGNNGALGKGERIVLTAIAQHPDGCDPEQITVLTGYKRSSRDTYLQKLRSAGYVTPGWPALATDEGVAALGGDFEPLPTGAELQAYWLNRLGGGEATILGELIRRYPSWMTKAEIDEQTGYKRSSRDTYLQKLKARKLIDVARGEARASDVLF